MLYIFYGSYYKYIYEKALLFAKKISNNPIIINETIIKYDKEDISLFLYYFSFPSSEKNQNVIIIENPENIKELLIQSFLSIFENIPEYHTIILITNYIQKIPKTIISRALLIQNEEKNEKTNKYKDFIEILKKEKFSKNTLEEILNTYQINEINTVDASIELINYFPNIKQKIKLLLKNYLPFIKNSYIAYWRIVFLLIKEKN
jgi:DNA polymerase III delta prime subunit